LREVDGTALCIGTSAGPLEGRLRIGVDQLRVTDVDGAVAYVPIGFGLVGAPARRLIVAR